MLDAASYGCLNLTLRNCDASDRSTPCGHRPRELRGVVDACGDRHTIRTPTTPYPGPTRPRLIEVMSQGTRRALVFSNDGSRVVDFGVLDSPDDFHARHGVNLSGPKRSCAGASCAVRRTATSLASRIEQSTHRRARLSAAAVAAHTVDAAAVAAACRPDVGLSNAQAREGLAQAGPNRLRDTPPRSPARVLLAQFKSLLILIRRPIEVTQLLWP